MADISSNKKEAYLARYASMISLLIIIYSAGVLTGAGAGIVVSTGLTEIADFEDGFVIVKDARMLITQINTARLHVAFSIKSVVFL